MTRGTERQQAALTEQLGRRASGRPAGEVPASCCYCGRPAVVRLVCAECGELRLAASVAMLALERGRRAAAVLRLPAGGEQP